MYGLCAHLFARECIGEILHTDDENIAVVGGILSASRGRLGSIITIPFLLPAHYYTATTGVYRIPTLTATYYMYSYYS